MEIIDLDVKSRTALGSRPSRRLRRQGLIPAVLYGHGMKPVPLEVNAKDLHHVLHTKAGENVVINLKVEGIQINESTCRIRDIQHDPITDKIAHVDFTVISLTEEITVKVPLVVKNVEEAVGVKEGGVVDIIHHEIEVNCLPTAIPEKFEIDIKDMKIGDIVHASDLQVPDQVKIKLEKDEALVALHPPAKMEGPAEVEEVTEPEVIEKGKKEGVEEEAPEEKPKAEKKPEKGEK